MYPKPDIIDHGMIIVGVVIELGVPDTVLEEREEVHRYDEAVGYSVGSICWTTKQVLEWVVAADGAIFRIFNPALETDVVCSILFARHGDKIWCLGFHMARETGHLARQTGDI